MDLQAIKARCKAATEGPWECHSNCGYCGITTSDNKPLWKPDGATFGDCAFIAHAREDIPALVAYVEELEAAIREHCHYFCVLSGEDGPYIKKLEQSCYEWQAENRLLRDMVAEYMLSLKEWSNEYWESRLEVAPLTAAEVARVQRLEKVAEAAKLFLDANKDLAGTGPLRGDAFEAICEMLHYDWGYKTVCTDLSYGCSGCAKHASNGGKCGEVRVEDEQASVHLD